VFSVQESAWIIWTVYSHNELFESLSHPYFKHDRLLLEHKEQMSNGLSEYLGYLQSICNQCALATDFEFSFLLDEANSVHIPNHDSKGSQFKFWIVTNPGTVESVMTQDSIAIYKR